MRLKANANKVQSLYSIKNNNINSVVKNIYKTKQTRILNKWITLIDLSKDVVIPKQSLANIIKGTHNQKAIFDSHNLQNGFAKQQTVMLNTFVAQQIKNENINENINTNGKYFSYKNVYNYFLNKILF